MKLRSMVLATCSVLFATTAQAAPGVGGGTLQVCDSDSVPNMTTGWMDSVTLARFDPDLGILTGVDVKLEATITGAASFESLSSSRITLR